MEFRRIAVFYDIKEDKKRKEFSDFLKNIGLERVQMSGFMGNIREDMIERLIEKCEKYKDDIIHVILLYKCRENVVLNFGFAYFPEDEEIVSL